MSDDYKDYKFIWKMKGDYFLKRKLGDLVIVYLSKFMVISKRREFIWVIY